MQWYQHSFFRLLLCIGDPKKVKNEVEGATGGVEVDPVLQTAGEDGKCLGDHNSLSIQRSSSVLQSIQRKQVTKTLSKGISEAARWTTVHGKCMELSEGIYETRLVEPCGMKTCKTKTAVMILFGYC